MHVPSARAVARSHSFALATAASVLGYALLFVLSQANGLRLIPTSLAWEWPWLGATARAVTPAALGSTPWDSTAALVHVLAFGLVALGLVSLWGWMLWLVRPGAPTTVRPRTIAVAIALCGVPLLFLVSLASSDLFLYAFYGRELVHYGENPLLVLPNQHWDDPHTWVLDWPDLPAAYGPVWLMASGALSWIAGESLALNVLVYKAAGLAVHGVTTWLVYALLSRRTSSYAVWGAVFYGLNPLALFELVGNAHNDGLAGLLVVAAILAVAERRHVLAAVLCGAALMTKAIIVVVLAPIVWAATIDQRGLAAQARVAALMAATIAVTALAIYAPLWAGRAIVDNVSVNPASSEYLNSVWQLLRTGPVMEPDERFVAPAEKLALLLAFGACLIVVLHRLYRGAALAESVAWTWLAFCGSLAWVWPWYFIPLCALAAASGPGRVAWVTGGITLGGLLFWMGWTGPPHPQAPWLFTHRALLFFGPAIVVGVAPSLVDATSALWQWLTPKVALPGRFEESLPVARDFESLDA